MRKILFIASLLAVICMLASSPEANRGTLRIQAEEAVVNMSGHTETMHHPVEFLSKDTRGGNLLTARRTVQAFSMTSEVRNVSEIVRITQDFRMKDTDRLQKVSASVTKLQTINHSALLTRMGYHVYALREIII